MSQVLSFEDAIAAHNAEHIIETTGEKDFTMYRQAILVKVLCDFMLKILVHLVYYMDFDREVAIRVCHALRDLVFLSAIFYGAGD